MTQPAPAVERRFPEWDLHAYQYQDARSGLKHVHLRSPGEDTFLVLGFYTPGESDCGIFHALEHLLLTSPLAAGGSLLALSKRFGLTYINGSTADDTVYFSFSSKTWRALVDFGRLALLSILNPTLREADFERELFKRTTADGPPIDGVLLNEMRGALSSPARLLWNTLKQQLYLGTRYQYNPGGNLPALYELTLDQLLRAHARYFVVSNCTILSMSHTDGHELFRDVTESIDAVGPASSSLSRLCSADTRFRRRAIEHDLNATTYYSVSWLHPQVQDTYARLELDFVNQLLLGHTLSPLRKALQDFAPTRAVSGVTGVRASFAVPCFTLSIESTQVGVEDRYLAHVQASLRSVADGAIRELDPEAAFDAIELKYSELYDSELPYGIKVLAGLLRQLLAGEQLTSALDLNAYLRRLRDKIGDDQAVCAMVKHYLITRPPCLLLTLASSNRAAPRVSGSHAAGLSAH